MQIDELKERAKQVKTPGTVPRSIPGGSLNGLIAAMMAEDAEEIRKIHRTMVLFSVLGTLYLVLLVLAWVFPPDQSPNVNRIVMGLAAALFLLIGVYSGLRSRRLARIDYAGPVLSFLEDSEKRYRFFNTRDLRFLVPYLLLVIALGSLASWSAFQRYATGLGPGAGIVAVTVVFVAAGLAGFFLGRRHWRRKRAPILEEIRRMKAALAAEESGGFGSEENPGGV